MAIPVIPILKLKFNVCIEGDCNIITFNETTEIYSASNINGYGLPNASPGDFISASLTIISPTLVSTTIDITTQGFPSDNSGLSYTVPLVYSDGIWKFIYTITDGGVNSYTTTIYKNFYCNSEKCVNQVLAKLNPLKDCKCEKESKIKDKYIKLWTMLESLKNKLYSCNLIL